MAALGNPYAQPGKPDMFGGDSRPTFSPVARGGGLPQRAPMAQARSAFQGYSPRGFGAEVDEPDYYGGYGNQPGRVAQPMRPMQMPQQAPMQPQTYPTAPQMSAPVGRPQRYRGV